MKKSFRWMGVSAFVFTLALLVAWPGGILQAQNGHNVTLTWSAPSTGGAPDSYNVKRATLSGSETVIGKVNAPATSFVDSTGTAGVTYFYVVTAVNSAGESPSSNEVSASFLVDPPGPPSGLAAVAK